MILILSNEVDDVIVNFKSLLVWKEVEKNMYGYIIVDYLEGCDINLEDSVVVVSGLMNLKGKVKFFNWLFDNVFFRFFLLSFVFSGVWLFFFVLGGFVFD